MKLVWVQILRELLSNWGYITTNEVAMATRISWNTAKVYLTAMWRRGWINRRVSGRTEYWKAKPPI